MTAKPLSVAFLTATPSSVGAPMRSPRYASTAGGPPAYRPATGGARVLVQLATTPRGLTLIEMLIVLLITAVLCGIAWPRFESQLHRARRSEAHSALAAVLNAQARYRSTHRHYASSLSELGWRDPSLRHYQLRLERLASPSGGGDSGGSPDPEEPFLTGFVSVASPLPASPQIRDTPCAELRLTLEGRQVTQSGIDASGVASTGCWPQ